MDLANLTDIFEGIDWGNAPSWVGSILTGLSLILAFRIILRDRKSAEREQAQCITLVWMTPDLEEGAGQYFIYNASDKPITSLRLFVKVMSPPSYDRRQTHTFGRDVLLPGERWMPSYPYQNAQAVIGELEFRDALRRDWSLDNDHNLQTVKPLSEREIRQAFKGAREENYDNA
ncbi:MAG: hypothetical protein JWO98_5384 [Frankiales bacterium]|nr:hypothetical protein [Frankiales bacterium]